jgi:hypothetical protein
MADILADFSWEASVWCLLNYLSLGYDCVYKAFMTSLTWSLCRSPEWSCIPFHLGVENIMVVRWEFLAWLEIHEWVPSPRSGSSVTKENRGYRKKCRQRTSVVACSVWQPVRLEYVHVRQEAAYVHLKFRVSLRQEGGSDWSPSDFPSLLLWRHLFLFISKF